jgi:hypothetical protein
MMFDYVQTSYQNDLHKSSQNTPFLAPSENGKNKVGVFVFAQILQTVAVFPGKIFEILEIYI